MLQKASVSVVIPCYNGERFLREAIDSVLAQTVPAAEIIVVDDGSTDNTLKLANSYGAAVRVISQHNQGESVARNRGMDESCAEWVAFLDADDVWSPDKLSKQLAAIGTNTVGVHTNVYFFGARTGVTKIQSVDASIRYSVKHLATENYFVTPSALMVRRDVGVRFPDWTSYAEDLIFVLSLVQKGEVKLVEEPLTGYRKHGASQSASAMSRIGWFTAMDEWIVRCGSGLSDDARQEIRLAHLRQVVDAAYHAKWRRNWPDFLAFREFLQRFSGVDFVQEFLDVPLYPKWLYSMFDCLRAMTAKLP